MSLVGTRPPTLDEWEKYELHHRARLAIKPGITGMWQVSGRSDITDFEEVVKLDMASVLLEKDTPLPVISDIIGHLDTNSTAVYLKVDMAHLAECPLDFEEVIRLG